MFDSAARIVIRNVSADFCAVAGEAPAPSSAAATIAAPSLNCMLMSSSFGSDLKTDLKHNLCQMALYHPLGRPDHGRWCHTTAAFDRDAAARVEPAARRNIGRI